MLNLWKLDETHSFFSDLHPVSLFTSAILMGNDPFTNPNRFHGKCFVVQISLTANMQKTVFELGSKLPLFNI